MPAVVMREVTKRFGDNVAVDSLSLDVAEGEVLGLLGPNGAGKTTTIRMLVDSIRPTSGRIEIFGRDAHRDAAGVHADLSWLPGDLAMFDRMTGAEHVEMVAAICGADTSPAAPLFERFGLDPTRPVGTLSRGNRQKVGLVLAFFRRPRVIVLDEPSSGLDPLMQREFHALVHETVADGSTVMVSSHQLDEVQHLVDRVAILRAGRLVVVENVDALRSRAVRHVELQFADPPDAAVFSDLSGVTVDHDDERAIELTVEGLMGELVAAAAAHGAIDIVSRPADLDEVFLTYYGEGER